LAGNFQIGHIFVHYDDEIPVTFGHPAVFSGKFFHFLPETPLSAATEQASLCDIQQ